VVVVVHVGCKVEEERSVFGLPKLLMTHLFVVVEQVGAILIVPYSTHLLPWQGDEVHYEVMVTVGCTEDTVSGDLASSDE
jgi:hypothetical protein